jgi:hypothetical protein
MMGFQCRKCQESGGKGLKGKAFYWMLVSMLTPPFRRGLSSYFRPTLRGQSISPRDASLQSTRTSKLLGRRERRGLILARRSRCQVNDVLCQLIRVAGTFRGLGHAPLYDMLDWTGIGTYSN